MKRFNYSEYNEEEQVLVSQNGMSFFYDVEDDSGWWGERAMMKNISHGNSKRDCYGFSSDGICEFQPGSAHTSVFVLGS